MSPPFRVVLHNDNENRREYVVQVLMKVIPGMTVDNAVNIMQEAHMNGMAVVIVCSQPEAEEHCTALRGNGLRSSIEPASGGCWNKGFFFCRLVCRYSCTSRYRRLLLKMVMVTSMLLSRGRRNWYISLGVYRHRYNISCCKYHFYTSSHIDRNFDQYGWCRTLYVH